jgi:hypothetical protein
MSYPNEANNPWKSLAELLSKKTDVAALATAIEKEGIRTWDRFGRMITATEGDANDLYSKARALDLLARVHEVMMDPHPSQDRLHALDSFLADYDCPLVRFGWPSDECPDVNKYKSEDTVPEKIAQAGLPQDDGLLGTRERNSLYAIIRVLLKEANMPNEPYKAGKIISDLTSDENGKCEVSQNCVAGHLKRMADPH